MLFIAHQESNRNINVQLIKTTAEKLMTGNDHICMLLTLTETHMHAYILHRFPALRWLRVWKTSIL